jgi:hypothetical protein
LTALTLPSTVPAIVAVRIPHGGSGHRTQTTALGPAVGAAGSSQDREKAAGWEGRPGVIAILVLLIIFQLVSVSCSA